MLFGRRNTSTTEVKLQELPLFKFEELATATKQFNLANQLGQGGFGLVYRGTLQNGQKIAVKRLSSASGQGLEEFMNEVFVISKLQHRNLVRLLGCSVEREEKILVYEFMPNKSLDTYLFDPIRKEFLDWRKRFNIIEGISREMAKDRPTMSTVISMLNSEIVDFPSPKQLAFILSQIATDAESASHNGQQRCSINNVTMTIVQGR
ncbi:hypothetical protein SLEP1_g29449 [Rubroshorea leprosula]|uniref:Protein kinase domain-containing protein n=1 Tax=Rubroshorea leprosula TaxID=152421 RepID=A0AAV5K3F6_9ROSI|nr:hypothetical protein SLEP1_g29449 [Rubroshorea leprosula]